ncbi:MAG: thiamine phosphate synthase [Silvibacterium sp.]|nr:thiamine phosphate synthase [Silvibacterium sp.]MBV8437555.1 thiamine phosphate synthase [Silvibacterium sp.]
MLLYAITSRTLLPGTEPERQAALGELARGWAQGGVDYIQIREKDLAPPDLLALARRIVTAVREEGLNTLVLVNGPVKIALEARAHGVHLPSSAPAEAAEEAMQAFRSAGRQAVVSRSCHSVKEIREAGEVSLILFAPVFEKVGEKLGEKLSHSGPQAGVGLDALREACRAAHPVPVIALGGITVQNAAACIAAGVAGVAGIRLFLGNDWRMLRSI